MPKLGPFMGKKEEGVDPKNQGVTIFVTFLVTGFKICLREESEYILYLYKF